MELTYERFGAYVNVRDFEVAICKLYIFFLYPATLGWIGDLESTFIR